MSPSWPQDGLQVSTAERMSLQEEEVPPKQEDVFRKGARALVALKISVAILLILAAIVVSSLTYVLINEQKNAYLSQFQEYSSKIILQFLQETQLRIWTCYSLSVAYTSEIPADVWPNVTLSHFSIRTFGSTAVSTSSAISFHHWSVMILDNNGKPMLWKISTYCTRGDFSWQPT